MSARRLVDSLADVRLENVFNPYSDRCAKFDLPDGPTIRRQALRAYFEAVRSTGTETAWMGRDLGHKGGRRTGLALTDEHHLPLLAASYPGIRLSRATHGPVWVERTATEIWRFLVTLRVAPLLWNVFPLHPHVAEQPFSNRKFLAGELRLVHALNVEILSWLGVTRIVAIGQDAANYGRTIGMDVVKVRHPSYGGVAEFRSSIGSLYGIASGRVPRLP